MIDWLVKRGVMIKWTQTEGRSADRPDEDPPIEEFLATPVSQQDSVNYAGLRTVVLELEESAVG